MFESAILNKLFSAAGHPSLAIVLMSAIMWIAVSNTFATSTHVENLHKESMITSEASFLEIRIDVLDERIYRAIKENASPAEIKRLEQSKKKLENRKQIVDKIQYEKYSKET